MDQMKKVIASSAHFLLTDDKNNYAPAAVLDIVSTQSFQKRNCKYSTSKWLLHVETKLKYLLLDLA
jgi:hypothetical protein